MRLEGAADPIDGSDFCSYHFFKALEDISQLLEDLLKLVNIETDPGCSKDLFEYKIKVFTEFMNFFYGSESTEGYVEAWYDNYIEKINDLLFHHLESFEEGGKFHEDLSDEQKVLLTQLSKYMDSP